MKAGHIGHIVIAIGEAVNCEMSPQSHICPSLYNIFVPRFKTYFNKTVAFSPFLEHVSNLHLGCHSYCEACKETARIFPFLTD